MVTNKMMSVAEKSFLTVASLTLCLTAERVLAGEVRSPSSNPPKFQDLQLTKVNSPNLLAARSPLALDSDRFSQPILTVGIDERLPLSVPQLHQSRLNLLPNRTLQQLNVIHNPDLANLINPSSLSNSIANLIGNARRLDSDPVIMPRQSEIPEPSYREPAR